LPATGKDAGQIIGKGGANIKMLRETSDCKVQVSEAVGSERIVTVAGASDRVCGVVCMVTTTLLEVGRLRAEPWRSRACELTDS
jgi:hypothetical protein